MADGTIKNRIVIEGEAQYKKALADINRALRESKSEMKAVSAEYAASGSSAKGLSAQIAALEKAHGQQADQLALMQQHLVKVTDAYGENSREAVELRTKINNARAEMAKTAAELTQLRTRLDAVGDAMDDLAGGTGGAAGGLEEIGKSAQKATGDVEGLGGELGGLGNLVPDIGGKLAGAFTAGAIAKGIGEGLSLGNERLVAWQNLAAYTGATGDNLERLKGVSETVYKNGYGDSLMGVTTAVAQVYQQTGLMDEELAGCVETALTLERVFGMDVGESTRAVTALMQNFGITAGEAYDLIVTGAQGGADKNGNLLDTINEYSPYFAGAGKGADEFFKALIDGAQAGVYDVDKVGDAWKEFMLRVTSGDKGPKEALKALGFAAEDVSKKIAGGGEAADLATREIVTALAGVEDPMRRNQLGVELFGTQWEDTGGAVLGIFREMDTGLGDIKGASEALNKVSMSDFDTALEGTKRRVWNLFAEFMSPYAQQAAYLLTGTNAWLDGKGAEGFWQAVAIDSGAQEKNVAERQQLMETYGLSEEEAFLAQIRGGDVDAALAYRDQVAFPERAKSAVSGWFSKLETAREGMGRMAAEAATDAATWWKEKSRSFAIGAATAIGDLIEVPAHISAEVDPQEAKAAAEAQKAAVVSQMETAYGQESGDDFSAWQEFGQRMIDSAYDEEYASDSGKSFVEAFRGGMESDAMGWEDGPAWFTEAVLPGQDAIDSAAKDYAESQKASVVAQMETAYGQENDDDFAAWQAFNQSMIDSAYEDSVQAAGELGEDEAEATIDAISSSSPSARRMGEYFGGEVVQGTQDGASGMYDAGAAAAQGAVEGARSGEDDMYRAGASLGGAFQAGFRSKMMIHSPSRAAMADMEMVTEGYLVQAERDQARLQDAAGAMAQALREGFTAAQGAQGAAAMPVQGAGFGPEDMAQAVRSAMDGMAFVMDPQTMSVHLEPYVSRATADRVSATTQGQSNRSRSW